MEKRGTVTDRHGRIWTVRVVRKDEADQADFEFWANAGPAARFEAAWEMVQEAVNWNPDHAAQPRLQRSLLCVQRR